AAQPEKEHRWLPMLAPALPLPIPAPLALGNPDESYPFHWTVCPWLAGANPDDGAVAHAASTGSDLARFIAALRQIDAAHAPRPGPHNFGRGVPLRQRDALTREAIHTLTGELDTARALEAWDAALMAPEWTGRPAWLHGDIAPGNLLAVDGRITAVIDFGGLAAGDPACDLMVAWNFLRGSARDAFRAGLEADDAGWARGRGWALSVALIQLPYYANTNQALAENSRTTIAEVLADFSRNG
ncbi:MAG: aminoglycoside phosphotransferase family protein, partial [Dehalococcoidia bacterium]